MHRKAVEIITARGHPNISATHYSTFEITRESRLTESGDCIVAVCADKALSDLDQDFKNILRSAGAKLTLQLKAENEDVVSAFGSPRLMFSDSSDIVVRKGDYVCNRTLAVGANKAACNLSRSLVERLRSSKQRVTIVLTAEV